VVFSRDEIDDAFAVYQRHVHGGDWQAWADLFVEEAVYLEHEYGTFYGREAIRQWIVETMSHATGMAFPVEWHVVDGERVIWYVWNQFPKLPGHATSDFQFASVSILRYAGNGRWASQEDVYNAREAAAVLAEYLQAAADAGVNLEGELRDLLGQQEL
jgi:ketosteroid isomerase-like protein